MVSKAYRNQDTSPVSRPDFGPIRCLCIIAGGMGQRAQELFAAQDIESVVGVTGSVEQVIAVLYPGVCRPEKVFAITGTASIAVQRKIKHFATSIRERG